MDFLFLEELVINVRLFFFIEKLRLISVCFLIFLYEKEILLNLNNFFILN